MDVQKRADTVAGAVVVVQPDLPERGSSENVQSSTGDALRKTGAAQSNVSEEDAREAVPLFGVAFLPRSTVLVMSVVPSRYWAPESTSRFQRGEADIGLRGDGVMNDGPVRRVARDGRKLSPRKCSPAPRNSSSLSAAEISVIFSFAIAPSSHDRKRHIATPSRR